MEGRRYSRLAEAVLIVLMGIGSLALWIGIPLGWLFVASRLSNQYPKVYLLALVFCPLTMIAFGWVLLQLNGRYVSLFPPDDQPRRGRRGREAWMRAVGADASERRPYPVLETFMSISVALAFVALLVWFFFFAGSSLPLSP